MTTEQLNERRLEELRRQVDALPREIAGWMARSRPDAAMKVHHTQLTAIKALMDAMLEVQKVQVGQLSPAAGDFATTALQITREVIRVQQVWEFFRDQLSLRFSPDFQESLWIADTVAWSCHRPVLEEASARGAVVLDEVREPPLTQVIAEFSPATWVRGSRPQGSGGLLLGTALLPIPVIQVPADHLVNSWELLSVVHEVGHDLEKDLGLESRLRESLEGALDQAGVPVDRKATWQLWRGELFADLVALQLAGSAFARSLMSLLLLPKALVVDFRAADPHPTPWVRILLNAAYVRTLIPEGPGAVGQARLRLEADAAALEGDWKAAYPDPSADADVFLADAPHVFRALMDTPFPELKGATARALMPFTAADDARIRAAADYLATGQNAPQKGSFGKIRQTLSAARLAVDRTDRPDLAAYLQEVDGRARKLVRDNTPDVVRGSDSAAHLKYVRSFAKSLLEVS